jgi:hypothetical protein
MIAFKAKISDTTYKESKGISKLTLCGTSLKINIFKMTPDIQETDISILTSIKPQLDSQLSKPVDT